jgi:hypothetical protein
MVKMLLGVTEGASKRLREEAKRRELTLSDLIRRIVDEWFERLDDKRNKGRK